MLPVGVRVDEVHIGLGIQTQRPEDNCAGDHCLAAEVGFDVLPHPVEISLFRLGEKHHPVELSRLGFHFAEDLHGGIFERFSFIRRKIRPFVESESSHIERLALLAEAESGAGVIVALGCREGQTIQLPLRLQRNGAIQAQIVPRVVGLNDADCQRAFLWGRDFKDKRVILSFLKFQFALVELQMPFGAVAGGWFNQQSRLAVILNDRGLGFGCLMLFQ